jgi:hypothetical protein
LNLKFTGLFNNSVAIERNVAYTFFLCESEQSPSLNSNLELGKTKKVSYIILDSIKINLMSQVKKLLNYGELSAKDYQNSSFVKFLDRYKIDLKLAVQVQLKTSF